MSVLDLTPSRNCLLPRWAPPADVTPRLSRDSLLQAPLFLEIVKIVADPASYPKYAVPLAVSLPTALLAYLLDAADLYPRLGGALASIVSPPIHAMSYSNDR